MVPDGSDLERLYAHPDVGRPWVRTNFVSTVDGAAYDQAGRSGSLGGAIDTTVFDLLRSLADVIVVGAGTARTEGYRPVRPDQVDAELRARLGLSPVPPIAVVSRRLDIPDELIRAGQLVITTTDAPSVAMQTLRETVEVIALGEDVIDWHAVLAELSARGANRLLCEGGPSLHGALVEQDLIDDVCLTIAPVMAAGPAPRIAHGLGAVGHPMTLAHAVAVDDVLLTRWVRERR